MIKLIALDLDDTLLLPDLSIPPETVEALRKAEKKGVKVMIASGRMFPSVRHYGDILGVSGPHICYNGAQIRRQDGSALFSAQIDVGYIRLIAAYFREKGIYMQCYDRDCIVVERISAGTHCDPDLLNCSAMEIGDFLTADLHATPKMVALSDPETIQKASRELSRKYGDRLHFTSACANAVEVLPSGISKAKTLALCAEKFGFDRSECMAVGDYTNDVEMVSWAGIGVAVGNAVPELKEIAQYVCTRQRSFGVREAVEKFVL